MAATAAGSPNAVAAARSPLLQASKNALAWSSGVDALIGGVVTEVVVVATVVDVEAGTDVVVVVARWVVTVANDRPLEPPEQAVTVATMPTTPAAAATRSRSDRPAGGVVRTRRFRWLILGRRDLTVGQPRP